MLAQRAAVVVGQQGLAAGAEPMTDQAHRLFVEQAQGVQFEQGRRLAQHQVIRFLGGGRTQLALQQTCLHPVALSRQRLAVSAARRQRINQRPLQHTRASALLAQHPPFADQLVDGATQRVAIDFESGRQLGLTRELVAGLQVAQLLAQLCGELQVARLRLSRHVHG